MFEFVIVLYGMTSEQSPTILSLNKLLAANAFPEITQLTIFDNSPEAALPQGLDARFHYYHNKSNIGLAKSYNNARLLRQPSSQWLVTFDQDTIVTKEYLEKLTSVDTKNHQNVVILAPMIKDGMRQISPVSSKTVRPLHGELPKADQTYENDIMVINSGSAVSFDFLDEIKGYNEAFPLDYLDHWLSWSVFKNNKEVRILPVVLQHQLSVLDYSTMALSRYEYILSAEGLFYASYQTMLLSDYKKQLLFRTLKQLGKGMPRFARKTYTHYKRIVGGIYGGKSN